MPSNPNSQNATNLGFESIASSRTSHNERLSLAELKFKIGQVIRFADTSGKLSYIVKTAPSQYVDLKTRKVVGADMIAGPLTSNAVAISTTEARNVIGANIDEFMSNFQKNKLVIDFETSITAAESKLTPSDVFNMSVGGIHPTKKNRYIGSDYFVTDLFDDMFLGDEARAREAHGRFATMSDNVRAGYFKRFNMYAKGKGINLGGASSMDELILQKDKMKDIMTQLAHADSPTEFDPKGLNLGVNKEREVRAGFGHSRFAVSFMRQSMQMDPEAPYTLGSFNPQGVDERAADAIGLTKAGQESNKYNFIDLRGNEMLRVSHIFPNLTSDMTTTMGPALKHVAHRMRFSDKQKKAFFQTFKHGISSTYRKGTTAEGFHEALRFAVDGRSKGFREHAHTAMLDVWDHIDQVNKSDQFLLASQQEAMRSDLRFHSPQERFLMGMIRYSAAEAGVDQSSLRFMPGSNKLKNQYLNRFDTNVNYSKLEKMISTNLESATSIKMEKNLLHSTSRTLGGSTVSQLLGGAFLLTGVRRAVEKMNERFLETRENNMEGMSHNSIPTTIRRLAMTDFGSGWYGTVSGSAKILSQMFRNNIANPKGTGKIVKKALSDISHIVKTYRKGGTYMEMLRNPDKMLELTDKVLGEGGQFDNLITTLGNKGILNETMEGYARKAMIGTRNVLAGYVDNITSFGSPDKQAKVAISRRVSEIFVKNGKLTASGAALGFGMLGAAGIMASRGNYTKGAAVGQNPYIQSESERLQRARENRDMVKQRVADLRATMLEGLPLASPERQQQRYSKTDFGSGLAQGMKTTWRYSKNLTQGKVKQVFGGFKKPQVQESKSIYDSIRLNPSPTDGPLPVGPSSVPRVNTSELITGPDKSFSDRVSEAKQQIIDAKNRAQNIHQVATKDDGVYKFVSKAQSYYSPNKLDSGKVTAGSNSLARKPNVIPHDKTKWQMPKPKHSVIRWRESASGSASSTRNPRVKQQMSNVARQITDESLPDAPVNRKVDPNRSHISARQISNRVTQGSPEGNSHKNIIAKPPTNRNYYQHPNVDARLRHLRSISVTNPNTAVDLLNVKKGTEEAAIRAATSKTNMDVVDKQVDRYRKLVNPNFGRPPLKDKPIFNAADMNLAPEIHNIEPINLKHLVPNQAAVNLRNSVPPSEMEFSMLDRLNNRKSEVSRFMQRPSFIPNNPVRSISKEYEAVKVPLTPEQTQRQAERIIERQVINERAGPSTSRYDRFGLAFKDNAISHEFAFGNRPKKYQRYGSQSIPNLPLLHKNPKLEPSIDVLSSLRPYNM